VVPTITKRLTASHRRLKHKRRNPINFEAYSTNFSKPIGVMAAYVWRSIFEDKLRSSDAETQATKVMIRGLVLSAPNKTAAQVGEKAGWLRAMGSSRRSA